MSAKPFSSVWTRERKGGREQGLTRDQIVRTAVELLDAEGLDALSMRRLGARLGAGATSLYWHVANKDELLELVMDEVYGMVSVPDDAGWRQAATAFAYGLRGAILEHPWSASLIGTLPALGPNALASADNLMAAFAEAGFGDMDVDFAVAAVVSFTLGATVPEVAWSRAAVEAGTDHLEMQQAIAPVLEKLASERPRLRERYQKYVGKSFDPAIVRRLSFDFGLMALLDGLGTRLH